MSRDTNDSPLDADDANNANDGGGDDANNDAVRDSDPALLLLRGALRDAPAPPRSLLPKVQDRLRVHTRGRYFRDRWSRSIDPIPLLLFIALFLLTVSAMIFLVLQPLVSEPTPVELSAPPIDPLAVPK